MKTVSWILIVFLCSLLLFPFSVYGLNNTIHAEGATFPEPLYLYYFDRYNELTNQKVLYQALGSGAGMRALLERQADIGATDIFLDDSLLYSSEREILHLPTCIGAVVITYNLPDNPTIRLTPDLIAGIFSGEITRWDDHQLQEVNPEIDLQPMEIITVHRYDESGTTFILSEYLSKVNPSWAEEVGFGKSLDWPVGYGAIGNAGVAQFIQRAEGSIGYVEMTFAESSGLPKALVRNRSGFFVLPTTISVSRAANTDVPRDTRIFLTDTSTSDGYPISAFSWMIFYREQQYDGRTLQQALALRNLLFWIVTEGQAMNETLNYAPLPQSVIERALSIIQRLTYDDRPILEYRDN